MSDQNHYFIPNEYEVTNWTPESMLEVVLETPDDFLKVKETLTRIGIASRKDNTLYQSCNILHKQGRYYIVNFKELFLLDGKTANLMHSDILRRNAIASLLQDWGLLTVVNKDILKDKMPLRQIKIIGYKEKDKWNLVSKYTIGGQVKRKNF
jgi:hypothetical protein